MTATTLHDSQSRLLGLLTIAVAQCLGDAATMTLEEDNGVRKLQMARVDEIVLLDHPADVDQRGEIQDRPAAPAVFAAMAAQRHAA
jgi:hypothetical protein